MKKSFKYQLTSLLLLSGLCCGCIQTKDLRSEASYTCPDLGGEAYFDWSNATLTISVPNHQTTGLKAEYAPLKFNKRMILSYTIDDMSVSAYSKGWGHH